MSPDNKPSKRIDIRKEVPLGIGESCEVAGDTAVTRISKDKIKIRAPSGFSGTVRDRISNLRTVVFGVDSYNGKGELVRTTTVFK